MEQISTGEGATPFLAGPVHAPRRQGAACVAGASSLPCQGGQGGGVSGSEGGRRPATAGFADNGDGISPNFIHPCSSEKDVQAFAGGFRSHSPHRTANWGWTRLYTLTLRAPVMKKGEFRGEGLRAEGFGSQPIRLTSRPE